uniref:Methyltransferase n=1 Tax=viral metagenome TaxID=1070528 RepID=A0A6H1ZM31_9ZZZZ
MKCKIFYGRASDVADVFNKWAKDKTLNSQVIIHTVPFAPTKFSDAYWIAIVVYHPSTQRWDESAE